MLALQTFWWPVITAWFHLFLYIITAVKYPQASRCFLIQINLRKMRLHLELSWSMILFYTDFTGVSFKLHVSVNLFSLVLFAQCVVVVPHFPQSWCLSSMFPKLQFNTNDSRFSGMVHRNMVSIRPVASGCRSS